MQAVVKWKKRGKSCHYLFPIRTFTCPWPGLLAQPWPTATWHLMPLQQTLNTDQQNKQRCL